MASIGSRIYTLEILFIHILLTTAWSHKEYEMSSDQVCSRMGRRELPITFEHPALVRDGGRLFSDWPGIRRYDCRWKVEGKRDGKGVTAVVQKVRLRKASEKDCVDYIQFKRESRVDKGPRVCGSVLFGILLDQNDTFPSPAPYSDSVALSEAVDPKSDWASLAAYGSIIDIEGEVMTYVHVAQKKLQLGEKIDMVVAYTAFQECREKVPEGSFHCGYGLCISSSLVKDGVINCPFSDCIDEGSCHEARDSNITRQILSKTMVERGGGADPTSSSFAALFILVVICLAIYYLYRRYRKSRRLPVEVYGTVNGTAQQQPITGAGYIEIPGSASNQPYEPDSLTQAGLILPYSLDLNQLQSITVSPYPVMPLTPRQPVMVPLYVPTQQPNPPSSPSKLAEGPSPPPMGFVIAEVSAPPAPIPTAPIQPSSIPKSPIQPSPVQPSPVQPSPVQPSPVQPSSVQPSSVQPSPVRSSPVQLSPVQPSPVQPSPVQPSPVQPSPVQPSPVQPSPVQPSPVQPSLVQPSPVQPSPIHPSPVQPSPVQPSPIQPSPVQPFPIPTSSVLPVPPPITRNTPQQMPPPPPPRSLPKTEVQMVEPSAPPADT